ncbi:MAG: hypothetical protein CENE_03690 [Candidatus Celerinatantimonas neptuna]|nr:MAG: hypothetical protein CENE_03690 [Candidatus Celerinatantimonas neptuna]
MARPCSFNPEEKLDEAMQLFWRQGYEATSIRDLEEHLCLNRFSIYNCFGDKEALYHLALKRYRSLSSQFWEQLINYQEGPVAALKRLLQWFMERIEQYPQGCLIQNALLERSGTDKVVQSMCKAQFETLEQVIVHQFHSMGWSVNQSRARAAFMVSQLQGLRLLGKANLTEMVALSLKQLDDWLEQQRVKTAS